MNSSTISENYVYISYRPTSDYFAIKINGNSYKSTEFKNGSILIARKQSFAFHGDMIIALFNKQQVIKKYMLYGTSIFLMSENNSSPPIPITDKDEFIILGKIIEIRYCL